MDVDIRAKLFAVIRSALSDRLGEYQSDADLAAVPIVALNLDSLEKLQLVLDLENALSVLANEAEIAACGTVGDLVSVMMGSRAAP